MASPTAKGASFLGQTVTAQAPVLPWRSCTLTWYDPALGGTNSASGRADPHSRTSSGQPYSASALTCAAPAAYPFGTVLTFRYGGKMVACKVNDRGGAIVGNHFDLARAPATYLGIISAGKVSAQFTKGLVPGAYGATGGGGGLTLQQRLAMGNPPASTLGGPGTVLGAAGSGIGDLVNFLKALFSGDFWISIAKVLGGFLIAILAFHYLVKTNAPGAYNAVKGATKKAGEVAIAA